MFLKTTVPSVLVAGVMVAGSAPAPAVAQKEAKAICKTATEAFERAFASGKPAKVAARFTTDGTETTPFGIFQGRQAIAKFNEPAVKPGAKNVHTHMTARQFGGVVVVCSGGFTTTFAPDSPMKTSSGQFTKVLINSKGEWLLADLSFSIAPPMPPHR
jgi:uncharacterized protein (TIGR02246 family)